MAKIRNPLFLKNAERLATPKGGAYKPQQGDCIRTISVLINLLLKA